MRAARTRDFRTPILKTKSPTHKVDTRAQRPGRPITVSGWAMMIASSSDGLWFLKT
jgi:hypothetical protein